MKTKQRVPFGQERRTTPSPGDQCQICQSHAGNLHTPGCSEEECPQCHRFVIGCNCLCLSTLDGTLITQGLYRKFTDMNQALQTTLTTMEEKKSGVSYLVHAAMQYMFENIDERGREKISHELHTSFPALKPTHYDKNGTGYYTAEQLAIAFDVSTQEIEEKISALSAAGFVIKNNKPKNLKRSQ